MPRKSLRPNLNQIRAWVRQGRTDAWVAHQLDVSVRDIEQFKRQNELVSDQETPEGTLAADYPDEIDLRAEDEEETNDAPSRRRRRGGRGRRSVTGRRRDQAEAGSDQKGRPLEGTFDP